MPTPSPASHTATAGAPAPAATSTSAPTLAAPSPTLLAGIVIGLAAALVMWIAWLTTHGPAVLTHAPESGIGGTATSGVTTAAVAIAMVLTIAWGVRKATGPGWRLGLIAGGVAGLVNLMLLGSVLTEQPENTAQMNEAANQFRTEAPLIVGGFFAISLLVGAAAGGLGSLLRTATAASQPGRWLARLAIITTFSMLPLIAIGGAVTSTESGMAVPDGVTSYGAVSVLFPLSLMAEPRIFLEHTHRLFGMLAGLHAIVLAIAVFINRPGGRIPAIVGPLGVVLLAAGSMGLNHAGMLSDLGMAGLTGLAAIGGLGFTHAMLSRRNVAAAACGLLALVIVQGLMGMQRVDENLVAIAAFHGIFAQLVVATAAMLCAVLTPTFRDPDSPVTSETAALGKKLFKFGMIGLGLITFQLILGAASRHLGDRPGGSHATLTHVVHSFVVLAVVILVAALATKGDAETPIGRTLKRLGGTVMGVLGVQFLLGWAALGLVGIGGEARPIPLANELATAEPIPLGEAIVTTTHQVGGALLLALVALAATWGRRAARGGPRQDSNPIVPLSEISEPSADTHESDATTA